MYPDNSSSTPPGSTPPSYPSQTPDGQLPSAAPQPRWTTPPTPQQPATPPSYQPPSYQSAPAQPLPNDQPTPTQPAPQLTSADPYPTDYLNQITPTAQQKPLSKLALGGIIAALIIALIVGAMTFFSDSGNSKVGGSPQYFIARLDNLTKVTKDARSNLDANNLRSQNSNLTVLLTDTRTQLEAPLEASGIKLGKIDKKVKAAADTTELEQTLEDGRLNAVYDSVYARELSYELKVFLIQMAPIVRSIKDPDLHDKMTQNFKDIESIQKDFAQFVESPKNVTAQEDE